MHTMGYGRTSARMAESSRIRFVSGTTGMVPQVAIIICWPKAVGGDLKGKSCAGLSQFCLRQRADPHAHRTGAAWFRIQRVQLTTPGRARSHSGTNPLRDKAYLCDHVRLGRNGLQVAIRSCEHPLRWKTSVSGGPVPRMTCWRQAILTNGFTDSTVWAKTSVFRYQTHVVGHPTASGAGDQIGTVLYNRGMYATCWRLKLQKQPESTVLWTSTRHKCAMVAA
jgi:hypothetical protein